LYVTFTYKYLLAARAAEGLRRVWMKFVKLHGIDNMGLCRWLSLDEE
jgi:hypothetical protein